MLNTRKIAAISICSVLIAGSIPAYAESTGSINISANINSNGFKGEIYVILIDNAGNQKLALLKENNNYKYTLDNLKYANYELKEVHVYNTANEYDKDRKDMTANYTLNSGNLNLSEKNQKSDLIIDIHSLSTSDKNETNKTDGNNSVNKADANDNIEITKEDDNKNEDAQSTENNSNKKSDKFSGTIKKYNFFSFIIDAVAIIGLGSIWFFKIRVRKDKDNGNK